MIMKILIRKLTLKVNIIRIKRSLCSDDIKVDGPIIANICYSPSYILFEYTLSYGLIPEYVSVYTSACFNKKNNKTYILNEANIKYKIAMNVTFMDELLNEKANNWLYRFANIVLKSVLAFFKTPN